MRTLKIDDMKTNFHLSLSAALFVATLTTTFAQSSWQTVDVLAGSQGVEIVFDKQQGSLIAIAVGPTTAPPATEVRMSSDRGATWHTISSIAGYAVDLSIAPDGALYASGNRTVTVSGRAVV